MLSVEFFFFGCPTRLAGFQFPYEGLKPGPSSESWVLTTGPLRNSNFGILLAHFITVFWLLLLLLRSLFLTFLKVSAPTHPLFSFGQLLRFFSLCLVFYNFSMLQISIYLSCLTCVWSAWICGLMILSISGKFSGIMPYKFDSSLFSPLLWDSNETHRRSSHCIP